MFGQLRVGKRIFTLQDWSEQHVLGMFARYT